MRKENGEFETLWPGCGVTNLNPQFITHIIFDSPDCHCISPMHGWQIPRIFEINQKGSEN